MKREESTYQWIPSIIQKNGTFKVFRVVNNVVVYCYIIVTILPAFRILSVVNFIHVSYNWTDCVRLTSNQTVNFKMNRGELSFKRNHPIIRKKPCDMNIFESSEYFCSLQLRNGSTFYYMYANEDCEFFLSKANKCISKYFDDIFLYAKHCKLFLGFLPVWPPGLAYF